MRERLAAHHATGARLADAPAAAGPGRQAPVAGVVRRLCGVQAQVASSAELAVRVRRAASRTGRGRPRAVRAAARQDLGDARRAAPAHAGGGRAFLSLMASGRIWERPSWQRYFGVTPKQMEALRGACASALEAGPHPRGARRRGRGAQRGLKHVGEGARSGWGTLLKPLAWQGDLVLRAEPWQPRDVHAPGGRELALGRRPRSRGGGAGRDRRLPRRLRAGDASRRSATGCPAAGSASASCATWFDALGDRSRRSRSRVRAGTSWPRISTSSQRRSRRSGPAAAGVRPVRAGAGHAGRSRRAAGSASRR